MRGAVFKLPHPTPRLTTRPPFAAIAQRKHTNCNDGSDLSSRPSLQAHCNTKAYPTVPALKVYQGGEVVKTIIGAKPKAALEADLAAFI